MRLIYHFELTLEEGYALLAKEKEDRLHRGKQVSRCSGWLLFKALEGQTISCWQCGLVADSWAGESAKNNHQQPVVNLLCSTKKGGKVMMTRDHIIPHSMGGTNDVANLRPGCERCNSKRGNKLKAEDLPFIFANPHLFNRRKFLDGMDKWGDQYKETHPGDAQVLEAARQLKAEHKEMIAQQTSREQKNKKKKDMAVSTAAI